MDNLNITAKDGSATVNIGKDVVKLTDHTSHTFKTDDIGAFTKYCKEVGEEGKKVFFSSQTVFMGVAAPDRYSEPEAICEIAVHEFVRLLISAQGKDFSLTGFEELLFTLRPYIDDAGRALYSYVRNFSAAKITSIKREVDNKGNFNHSIIREKGGASEFDIPETLTFTIPVVNADVDILKAFTFDVYFTWKDTSDGCQVLFKLKNPLLGFEVDKAVRETLMEVMSVLNCPKHWVTREKREKNDDWSFLFNGIDIPSPTTVNNYR